MIAGGITCGIATGIMGVIALIEGIIYITKTPEEYIKDQFYISTQPVGEPNNQEDMRKIMEVIGFDRMMFSSDYPHFDFDHPEGLEKFLRVKYTCQG